MRQTFISLFSLFLSCFILLLGNGLINVLLPVRMGHDGISTNIIGIVLSLYFVGLLIGALYSTSLIKRAGHIRIFTGCASLGAVSILICSLYSDPLLWGAMRIVLGFCIACTFTAMESWLSDSSTKETRGQVLAIYNSVMLAGLFGGQFFMNIADVQDNVLFVIAGILLCSAVIPVALSHHAGPAIQEVRSMSLLLLYKRSPLGVVSCLVSGMIYSALFSLLPVFAKEYDIIGFQLSLYMGAAILGAFILQFPVGYLSDRFDRRTVLFVLLLTSAAADLVVIVLAPSRIEWAIFLATAVTSGIIACTYPLSITEAFDKLRQSEMVSAMGSMILAFALGGIIGPYSASLVMDSFGSTSLFYFLALIQLFLACFVIFRMFVRQALPNNEKEHFVMQGTATASVGVLDPRTAYIKAEIPTSAEINTVITMTQADPTLIIKMIKAIVKTDAPLGLEIASTAVSVTDIDIFDVYEAMNEAMCDISPSILIELTLSVVLAKPDQTYAFIYKLAQLYPDQVAEATSNIEKMMPELSKVMARAAMAATSALVRHNADEHDIDAHADKRATEIGQVREDD
ncbi:MFS transporter [Pseudoalteromonas sp. NBT06-2]|uniref:MFS transporter n=1 Tax=Pseudoalteromonas sp. NBT06-2 TaxID=2025950 RepID=UPI00148310F5|nr:MFS transporter [Pseudoalteromonas sp. NBT06-2]